MKNLRKILYLKIAKFRKNVSNVPVPSIISFGTKIKGNILDGEVIHIDGRLEGNVCCEELVIGTKGQVIGQVRAKNLSLYGILQGTAEADSLFIAGSARLIGDALHNSIAIEPGAYIEGRCIRLQKKTTSVEKIDKEPSVKKTPMVEKAHMPANNPNLFKTASGGNK